MENTKLLRLCGFARSQRYGGLVEFSVQGIANLWNWYCGLVERAASPIANLWNTMAPPIADLWSLVGNCLPKRHRYSRSGAQPPHCPLPLKKLALPDTSKDQVAELYL